MDYIDRIAASLRADPALKDDVRILLFPAPPDSPDPPDSRDPPDVPSNVDRVLNGGFIPGGFIVPPGQVWMLETGATVETDRLVDVQGRLIGRGSGDFINPTRLRFVNADGTPISEEAFVGGGMGPIASDIGLWVTGSGLLDFVGTKRTRWTRGPGGFRLVNGVVIPDELPPEWEATDEMFIVPYLRGDFGLGRLFDRKGNPRLDDDGVHLFRSSPPTEPILPGNPDIVLHAEPYVLGDPIPTITLGGPSGPYETVIPTEIVNLSVDLEICGTPRGRTCVMIVSDVPQTIKWCGIRYTGPRHAVYKRERDENKKEVIDENGDPVFERDANGNKILGSSRSKSTDGRGGIHFHRRGDASRNSLLEGVLVRDCGGHAYITHASHGVKHLDCLGWHGNEDCFWWNERAPAGFADEIEDRDERAAARLAFTQTDDPLYEHCGSVFLVPIPNFRGYGLSSFMLGRNTGGILRDSFAAANLGGTSAAGAQWPSAAHSGPNIWTVEGPCVFHNIRENGSRVWQNDGSGPHIADMIIYHCGAGIFHGAYGNPGWFYVPMVTGCDVGIVIKAQSTGRRDRAQFSFDEANYALGWRGGYVKGCPVTVALNDHTAAPRRPVLIRGVDLGDDPVFIVDEGERGGWLDVVDSRVANDDFELVKLAPPRVMRHKRGIHVLIPGTVIRIQDGSGTALRLDDSGMWLPVDDIYPLPEPDQFQFQASGEITLVEAS